MLKFPPRIAKGQWRQSRATLANDKDIIIIYFFIFSSFREQTENMELTDSVLKNNLYCWYIGLDSREKKTNFAKQMMKKDKS